VVVDQHLTEEVQSLFVYKVLVSGRHEFAPRLLRVSA
jgi:hypothetical protein